jgi:DNA-directed RNA polymerase I, II, and III subunit RPABC3
MDLVLDYNNQIYKLPAGCRFTFCLARTLALDGSNDPNEFNQSEESSLMDGYEYVMHGKVFKITAAATKEAKMEIFASFGGLLMSLRGDPRNLSKIELDMRIYCLIKKPVQ